MEDCAGILELSGWVSMASESEGSKGWAGDWGGLWGAVEAVASASGTSGWLRGGGTGHAVQSLYPAEWSSVELGERTGQAIQLLRTGLWFRPLREVRLGHRCCALD